MPQSITPLDILTTQGKHPEREQSDECTSQVRINAADLAERVSRLLDHLGVRPSISSGFRTAEANRKTGGSGFSAHCEGKAVDLYDPKGALATTINRDISILDTFNLYMENTYYTPGWVHLSTRPTKSGRRIFIP